MLQQPGLTLRVAGGRVAKLSLHVPWASLGAQPLVITLQGVECLLVGGEVPDEEDSDDAQDGVEKAAGAAASATSAPPATPGGMPSYVQAILQGMLAGIVIKVSCCAVWSTVSSFKV